ncbi:hypothetical protein F5146DRAFT_1054461 [Armillaria mellea]|nr:hypothetical protein F5146DRAFT_1054461 [Armillaria mellea]
MACQCVGRKFVTSSYIESISRAQRQYRCRGRWDIFVVSVLFACLLYGLVSGSYMDLYWKLLASHNLWQHFISFKKQVEFSGNYMILCAYVACQVRLLLRASLVHP